MRPLQQAHRVADEPYAGHRIAAQLLACAERPAVDQLERDMVVVLRGVEEHVGDGHRRGRTEQRDACDALGMSRCALEDGERSHRMADERRCADPGRIEQRGDPAGDRFDGSERGPQDRPCPGRLTPAHSGRDAK
jgi:hypothetical protein